MHQNFFSASLALANIVNILIPIYTEFMKKLGLSPLILYGVLFAIGFIIIRFFKEIKYKNSCSVAEYK